MKKTMWLCGLLVVLGIGVAATSANLVVNGSFEAPWTLGDIKVDLPSTQTGEWFRESGRYWDLAAIGTDLPIPDGTQYYRNWHYDQIEQWIGNAIVGQTYQISASGKNGARVSFEVDTSSTLLSLDSALTGIWETKSVEWTCPAGLDGKPMIVYLCSRELGRADYDNISVVPEPATLSMMAIGLSILLRRKR